MKEPKPRTESLALMVAFLTLLGLASACAATVVSLLVALTGRRGFVIAAPPAHHHVVPDAPPGAGFSYENS